MASTAAANGPIANPIFVAANSGNPESDLFVSERTADVLAKYNFEIDTTNQVEGTVATQYKVGSSILEPWHRESIGFDNRLESTLQSIRRKVLVHFVRVEGGYLVSVEALKEMEDRDRPHAKFPRRLDFFAQLPAAPRFGSGAGSGQSARLDSASAAMPRSSKICSCRLQAAYAVR